MGTEGKFSFSVISQMELWLMVILLKQTEAWAEWLLEAEDAAKSDPIQISYEKIGPGRTKEVWKIRNWDFKKALSTLMSPTTDRKA